MIEKILYIFTTFLAIILVSIYIYKKWRWSYWNQRGLETFEPKKFMDIGSQYYDSYFCFKKKGLKHGGTYLFFDPHYIPVDLDIIKKILIADFDKFVNRGLFDVDAKTDNMNAHLFNLQDQRWKTMRSKLSPIFTSGKLKMMFETLAETTWGLEKIFEEYADSKKSFEMKDVMARFTTDVIGSVAFGLECNSLQNPESEFRQFGKLLMDDLDTKTMPIFLLSSFPRFIRYFCFEVLKRISSGGHHANFHPQEFFYNVVKETVAYRESNSIRRNDFLHLLLVLKNKGTLEEGNDISTEGTLTLIQVAAQCFLFFIGGYDTSSTAISFALYELARHPDIQEKLREEIHETLAENDGKMSYDLINKMTYLDKIVNESLRMHPPVRFLSRKCNQDFPIPGTNFTLKKGEKVMISTEAIHYDSDLYHEPEKFDPERFSPEKKNKMRSVQFLPFGEGPRMCIGSRFGLMQTKVGLTCILNKFKVSLDSKTKLPLNLTKSFLTYGVKDGIWFNVQAI